MKKLLFVLGLLVPVLLSAQQVPRSLTAANGTFIGFYEYKPPMYTSDPNAKFPLIIFLHGIGERGDGSSTLSSVLNVGIPRNIHYGLTNMQFNYNGTQQGFLVLSPQLSYNYGNWQAFYIEEMIKYAKQNLRVDPARIYLTGLSLGGGGVWNYATSSATAAQNLAAIAPICGTCDWSSLCTIAQNNLPVWAFHAMDDGVVGVGCTQAAINGITACGAAVAPLATYYPTGNHWIWDQVYDPANPQLYLWFLSKSRGAAAPPPGGGGGGGSNVPPTANPGTSQTITLPTNSATLTGSSSWDQDGSISSYSWSEVSGPNSASIGTASAANTTVANLIAGTYTFRLTVTDNAGASSSANVNVTVNQAAAPSNQPPVAVAGSNQTITLPTSNTILYGSGSYDPGGGSISNYAWSQQSGPNTASLTAISTTNVEVKNMVAGTYVFKLTVTDNQGATGSSTVQVTVNGTSGGGGGGGGTAGAPVAVAGNNQTITLPTNTVWLAGSGSYDQGGWITNYAWSQQSGPNNATIISQSPSNVEVRNMIAGTYVFALTVTDNSGQTGTATVQVTVNGTSGGGGGGGGTGAPVAVAGNNQTITLPTNSVWLAGSGSYDQGGWISNYSWTQQSGPNNATITAISSSNVEVKNMIAGTYVFKLTVTDNSGLTGSSTVQVTVNGSSTPPPPVAGAPTAVAGNDQYVTLPSNGVYLMGGGSYDVGGWITGFAWSQVSGPNTATMTVISSSNVEVKNFVAGTYTFRLTVTDNSGATGTSTMRVIVNGGSVTSATTDGSRTGTTLIASTQPSTTTLTSSTTTTTSSLASFASYTEPTKVSSSNNSLVLYPNPVKTSLNVEVSNSFIGDLQIVINDASGKPVKTIKASKSSTLFTYQVNMQDVLPGTYVVEIVYGDGSRQSSQVVKQ